MRIVLLTDGSRGDAEPFLSLAHALHAKSHSVLFIGNASHTTLVAPLVSCGALSDAVFLPQDFHTVLTSPAISAALGAADMPAYLLALMPIWCRAAVAAARPAREACDDFGADVIVAGTGPMLVALSLGEVLRVPVLHAPVLPLAFDGWCWPVAAGAPPWGVYVAGGVVIAGLGRAGGGVVGAAVGGLWARWVINAVVWWVSTAVLVRLAIRGHNAVREVFGLKEDNVRAFWRKFYGAKRLGCYSKVLFGGRKVQEEATGYWHGPEWGKGKENGGVTADVEKFCGRARRAGRRVGTIGWGSMVLLSRLHLTVLSLAAAAIADVDVVLIGGWAGMSLSLLEDIGDGDIGVDIEGMLREASDALRARGDIAKSLADWAAEHAMCVNALPHAFLFRLVDFAVHHGGSGTTHACLRSAVPMVVCPVLGDQGGWADRIERKACGRRGPPLVKVGALKLGGLVAEVAWSDMFREGAERIRREIGAENGAEEAVTRIEAAAVSRMRSVGPARIRLDVEIV